MTDRVVRHKNRILEYMRKAEIMALKGRGLEYRVYVDDDGMPFIYESTSGSTWYPVSGQCVYTADYTYADMLDQWTDSHGFHPYAFLRDNQKSLEDAWQQAFKDFLDTF